MKRVVILTAVVAAGLAATAVVAQRAGPPRIPPTGKIEKIRDNLYKIGGAGSNTTVFIRSDGVVLVDTKLPNNGQAILDQVRTVTDKPVTMLINTHVHPDHNGSNDFFKQAAPKIEVVAHANTAKWVAANPRAAPAMKPDKTFQDRMTLGKGKDRIDFYYFGAGHTDGDAFIVFPSVRAMNIGDLMAWKAAPLIDPGTKGSVVALPDTLEGAAKTIKKVDLVIEGHGDVSTWKDFLEFTAFNRALLEAAKTAQKTGQTREQALAELEKNPRWTVFMKKELLKDLEYGGTPYSRAVTNMDVAFKELRGEPVTLNFGPPPPPPAAPATPPAPNQ